MSVDMCVFVFFFFFCWLANVCLLLLLLYVFVDFKWIYFLFTFSEVVIDHWSEKKDSNGNFQAPSIDQATEMNTYKWDGQKSYNGIRTDLCFVCISPISNIWTNQMAIQKNTGQTVDRKKHTAINQMCSFFMCQNFKWNISIEAMTRKKSTN